MRALVLVAVLLTGGVALAQEPAPFQQREMTAEEYEAARSAGRPSQIDFYGDVLPPEAPPFPRKTVVFLVVGLAVALPFGLRIWRNMAKEMEAANTFGVNRHTDPES